MAKIICITSGLTGILNASFELVNRLKADGHSLLYASPKKVGELVLLHGIDFTQLPEIKMLTTPELPSFSGPLRKISRWLYKIRNSSRLQKEALKNIEPIGFIDLVKQESPDLLLIDVELHEYILKAYSLKTPVILLSQWFSLWKRDGLPYLLHDTIPGKGLSGSNIGIESSWLIVRMKRWWTFLNQKIYSVGTNRRSILLNFARQENFPLEYLKENNWPGPFSYATLPVISMTAEEMEFPHPHRPNSFYVGPMVAENRKNMGFDADTNSRLDKIIEQKNITNQKLIYCSVSTLHQGDHDFLKRLIKAVSDRKDWLLVIGMGGLIANDIFRSLGSNVFAFTYLPQLKILKEADCSINHGGIHTINECIHYGVPMLVYSGKRSDQNGCAARVEFHKLGFMADKDIDKSEDIAYKINKILHEPHYQNNINTMQNICKHYKSGQKLETIINNFLTQTMVSNEKISA